MVNYRTFQRWMQDRPSMPRGAWELLQIRILDSNTIQKTTEIKAPKDGVKGKTNGR
jgi:hypothetical protein